METPVEKIAADLLKDIDKRETQECLSIDSLGEYIEQTLPSEEWDRVESHLRSCLYCLNQLVELRELLFLEENAEPLPKSLERKLRRLAAQETGRGRLFETLKEWAISAVEAGQAIFKATHAWQAVSGFSLALLILMYLGFLPHQTEDYAARVAATVGDSIVTVRGMDSHGTTVRQGAGVIVDLKHVGLDNGPRGFVLLPLHLVTEITSGRVTLTSGASLPIKGLIGADPESDLAVVELDASTPLKALKIADPSAMRVGQKVFAVSRVKNTTPQVTDGVLGDGIPLSPRTRSDRETRPSQVARRFISVGATDGGVNQAILVDDRGEVVSANAVSAEGEKGRLAMPIGDINSIIKSPKTPVPLDQLKYKAHPPEALVYYLKGILAYNSDNTDEAISYYEKCLKVDNSFDRCHEELAGMYFLKGDYEKEVFHYKEAVKLNPENIDARAYLAQAYEDEGRYDLAIKEFEQLLAIKSDDEEARYNLGIDYLVIGRTDKALEQYDALKKIHEGAANKLKRIIDLALPRRGQVHFRDPRFRGNASQFAGA
jgi:tetratricopeptide (TPR) repeat protein